MFRMRPMQFSSCLMCLLNSFDSRSCVARTCAVRGFSLSPLQASGLPPNVDPCSPGRMFSMISWLASAHDTGSTPPDSALPSTRMSGLILSQSQASSLPVLKNGWREHRKTRTSRSERHENSDEKISESSSNQPRQVHGRRCMHDSAAAHVDLKKLPRPQNAPHPPLLRTCSRCVEHLPLTGPRYTPINHPGMRNHGRTCRGRSAPRQR